MESDIYNNKKRAMRLALVAVATMFSLTLAAQQHIISKKDNTRPETARQYNSFNLTSFTVIQQDGYNQVQWQAPANGNGSRFFIEYSFDGVHFLGGEEVLSNNGLYNYRHFIRDTRPLLYRVRTENTTGSLSYSGAILPKGISIEPVQLQKNVVSGNVINVTAQFPVERLTIVTGTGLEVYARDVNGLTDFIPVAIPSLDRGVYFITFFGNGWKSTSRFVVQS